MDRLEELNEVLYEQIKRLASDNLTETELDKEIERAKAMAIVSSQFIASSTLHLRTCMMLAGANANVRLLESKDGI